MSLVCEFTVVGWSPLFSLLPALNLQSVARLHLGLLCCSHRSCMPIYAPQLAAAETLPDTSTTRTHAYTDPHSASPPFAANHISNSCTSDALPYKHHRSVLGESLRLVTPFAHQDRSHIGSESVLTLHRVSRAGLLRHSYGS